MPWGPGISADLAVTRAAEITNGEIIAPALLASQDISVIGDTGASHRMISLKSLSHLEKKSIKPLGTPVWLSTANGFWCVTDDVSVYIEPLQQSVKCLVMHDTLPALSIGTFVMDDDYEFIWNNKSAPYLRHIRSTNTTTFDVRHNVPHLLNKYTLPPHLALVAAAATIDAVAPPDTVREPDRCGTCPAPLEPVILSRDDRLKLEARTTKHQLLQAS
jgi:hypothetical protein